ncbi:hypothetical protein CLV49_3564 [Labedella gwakjiensis]|uniref:Uncharacterized protein n=1 Tax=Labedella gwakjiensis TaxID=390269 RepID=A0A2P8H117_9MICO|nr:hypothetical protein [Labedella gwakjiensis]PSL39909.1 hypothetical protein CLV49_3564 [Labedella gwakjiensis]RUQ85729.1 hypothetical protein ELQ93_01440 [Labedella gwakjiensis]
MNRRRARVSTAAAVAVLVALSGCSSAPAPRTSASVTVSADTAAEDAAAAATDGHILVGVTQGRTDYTTGMFAISVENVTDAELIVRSARLSSPAFDADASWDGDAIVPAGRTRDLRIAVPEFDCPATDPMTSIVVSYESDGDSRTAVLAPVDEFSTVERLSDAACFTQAVSEVVAFGLADRLDLSGQGPAAVTTLSLTATPVAGPGAGSLTVLGVDATTLLSPASGDAAWSVDERVAAGDSPTTIALPAVPARCDAHAVAEDKVGTVLRVRVLLTGGTEGSVSVPASSTLRADLYAFVTDRCGLSG